MESLGCTSKLWCLCTSGATALVLIRAYQCSLQFLALEFVKGMMAMGIWSCNFIAAFLKYVVDVSLNLLSFQADETTRVLF
jgi:hypothetical protein